MRGIAACRFTLIAEYLSQIPVGIFMDDARNAALPMIAKAPNDTPGQA